MIFQEPMTSLNPAYTIGNQLEEALLRHRRVGRRQARERALYLLDRVGIPSAAGRLKQYPHQLSGGLRQRVMIAMALMCGPSLILADEPTTALDVTIQAQILHLLAELQREFAMGLVLITHDLGIVARIATRVAVMYAGQVVETGTAQAIFSAPAHPYTRGLLACIPVPGKTRRGEKLGTIPGMVPSLIGEMRGCHFAGRCPYVVEACRESEVPLEPGGAPDHLVRCIRHAEIAGLAARPVARGGVMSRAAASSGGRGGADRGGARRGAHLPVSAGLLQGQAHAACGRRRRSVDPAGRGGGAGRRVGLRQDHAGAHAARPAGAVLGRDPHRRQGRARR